MARTIPIIKLRQNLIVSIQIELSDRIIAELKENVAHDLRVYDVSGLVIEVSAVDFLDSYIARSIQQIAKIAACMGTETILAGLDASVAITLVEMGVDMIGVKTALDLEDALDLLEAKQAEARRQEEAIIASIYRDLGEG
ncbi:MAG TPA: STAS domain-containing protein [Nannocystaceae bacterium]|nr:STAS domain-containing protein [Nannocystaceae bacterium]